MTSTGFNYPTNLKEIRKQLREVEKSLKKLTSKRQKVQVRADELAKTKKEIREIDVRIGKLRSKKARIRIDTADAVKAKEQLQEVEQQLLDLQAKRTSLEIDTTALTTAKTELQNLSQELSQLHSSQAELQMEAQALDTAIQKTNTLRQQMVELTNETVTIHVTEVFDNVSSNMIENFSKLFGNLGGSVKSSFELGKSGLLTSLDLAGDFEQMVASIANASTASAGEIEKLETTMMELGSSSGFSPTEVGAAALVLTKGGLSTAQLEAGALADTLDLAAASGMGMNGSAAALLDTMSNFGLEAKDANGIVNALAGGAKASRTDISSLTQALEQIGTDASGAGVSLNETVGMLALLSDQGIAGSAAASSLKGMLANLVPSTGRAAAAMEKYGLSFVDANGNIDDMAAIAEKLQTQLGHLGDAEQTQALQAMFDVEGAQTAAVLMRDGAAAVEEYVTATNDSNAASKLAAEQMASWQGTLQETDSSLSTMATTIGQKLQPVFQPFIEMIGQLADESTVWLNENEAAVDKWRDVIGNAVGQVMQFIQDFDFEAFGEGLKNSFEMITTFAQPFIELIKLAGGGSLEKGLGRLPGIFLTVAGSLKVLGGASKIFDKFKDLKLPSLFGKGGSDDGIGGEAGGADLGANWKNTAESLLDGSKNLLLIWGAIKLIEEAAEAMKKVDEKVPDNLGLLVGKLSIMTLAISVMGGLVAAAGYLSEKNPTVALVGLGMIAAISFELILAAEAMRYIDEKVPADFKTVENKMENMGFAIGAFAILAGVIGTALTMGGPLAVLAEGAGLLTIALVAKDIMLAADAIKEMDEKVPADSTGVKEKLNNLVEIINYFIDANFGDLLDLIDTKTKDWSLKNVVASFNKLEELADLIEKINDTNFTVGSVKKRLTALVQTSKAFNQLDDFKIDIDTSMIETAIGSLSKLNEYIDVLEETLGFSFDQQALDQFKVTIENTRTAIQEVLKANFAPIESVQTNFVTAPGQNNQEVVTENMSDVSSLEEMEEWVNQAVLRLEAINLLLEPLRTSLAFDFNEELLTQFSNNIENIRSLIKEVMTLDLAPIDGIMTNYVSAPGMNNEKQTNVIESELSSLTDLEMWIENGVARLKEIQKFTTQLEELMKIEVDDSLVEKFNSNTSNIRELIKKVMQLDLTPIEGTLTQHIAAPGQNETVTTEIQSELSSSQEIEDWFLAAIDRLEDIQELNSKLKDQMSAIDFDESEVENFSTVLKNISKAISEIMLTDFVPASDQTTNTSNNEAPNDLLGFSESIDQIATLTLDLETKIEKINALNEVLANLDNEVIDSEKIQTTISNAQIAVESIRNFANSDNQISDISTVISSVGQIVMLIQLLNELTGSFEEVGANYATALLNGWDTINPSQGFIDRIWVLINEMKNRNNDFTELGKLYGRAIKVGFSEGINGFTDFLQTQINLFQNYTEQFRLLGTGLGNTLVEGFKSGIAGMSDGILEEIRQINNALGGENKALLNIGGIFTKIAGLANGGEVAEYRAEGGSIFGKIFKPKGTDTVPAMLTPGEWVHRTAAVRTFGPKFMDKVNKLDVHGVYQELTHRFIGRMGSQVPVTSMATVNNSQVTNNDPTINQYFGRNNPSYSYRRAWKHF